MDGREVRDTGGQHDARAWVEDSLPAALSSSPLLLFSSLRSSLSPLFPSYILLIGAQHQQRSPYSRQSPPAVPTATVSPSPANSSAVNSGAVCVSCWTSRTLAARAPTQRPDEPRTRPKSIDKSHGVTGTKETTCAGRVDRVASSL